MNGEFHRIAERIARITSDGGITVQQLNEIISTSHGDEVNCYPGNPSNVCYPLAYFISLQGKLVKGRSHYNFSQILEIVVQHMQGNCANTTRCAVIITDSWLGPEYEKWRRNLEQMKREGIRLEAFLVGLGGWATLLSM